MVRARRGNNERIDVWFYEQQRWVSCIRKIMRSNVVDDLPIEFIRETEKALIEKETKEEEEKKRRLKCQGGYLDCLEPACEHECINIVVAQYAHDERMEEQEWEQRSKYRGHWDGHDWIYTMNNENGWVDAADSDDQ